MGVTVAGRSRLLHERASRLMPGGVSSPVRAFGAVGGVPRHIVSARGAYLTDADGNRLLDMVCGWGAAILGHGHHAVARAVRTQASIGTAYGLSSPLEADLAERVVDRVGSVEMVRFVNSGTEAVMSAVRLARAVTGRGLIVRFEGNYHGHADGLTDGAGSGVLTLGLGGDGGQGGGARSLVIPYNDAGALVEAFGRFGERIAAVLLEPLAGNMGLVLPEKGFLETARSLTRARGALLICDEVMTGFRVARGGAQARLGVDADLTTFGKVLGGGLPVGAYGGPPALMERVAPIGDVYQAGTASGNPLTMAAGIATLDRLDAPAYARLETLTARAVEGLRGVFGGGARVEGVGSMLGVFFGVGGPVRDHAGARAADHGAYARFFGLMLERGVHLPPSGYEAWFLSLAHTESDIDRLVSAAGESWDAMRGEGWLAEERAHGRWIEAV